MAGINLIMAVFTTIYFLSRKKRDLHCDKGKDTSLENGKIKNNIGEFAIFTIDGKTVANGTVITNGESQ